LNFDGLLCFYVTSFYKRFLDNNKNMSTFSIAGYVVLSFITELFFRDFTFLCAFTKCTDVFKTVLLIAAFLLIP